MLSFIVKIRLVLLGAIVGALAGYFYWQQIGCVNGTCPITSNWFNSTAYGAILGGLLFDAFRGNKT
jgi:xanthosine utilization system XapX-like protein